MAKRQMMLYIDEEIVQKLDDLAEQYKRKSGNVVAVEILEQYAAFWEAAEEARRAILEEQRAGLFDNVYARGKTTRGEIEKVKKDAISRKKNR